MQLLDRHPLAAKIDTYDTMKRIKFLIIGLLLLNQLGASQSINDKIIKLNIDFDNAGLVNLSEIISEIKYLPLETNANCLIGNMNIPVYGEYIIIRSYTGSINGAVGTFRFSNQGKFLNKIGNIGRGPGEYQDNSEVVLINDTIFIISNFSNRIFSYSLSGMFLKEFHLNSKSRPNSMVQLPDKSYMISLSNPSDYGIILKTDRNFNVKTGYIKNIPLKNNPLPFGFQTTKNKIFFYYSYLDTIFDISKGYPVPAIICDYGKFKKSKPQSLYQKENPVLGKPHIISFSASEQYLQLWIYYPFNKSTYTTLYRIADGKQVTWTKLVNNIDGGTLDRWEGFLDSENNLILQLMPSTIIARFEKISSVEKLNPKNSGFINMASKVTLESNPVIMIGKLK